MRRLKLGAEGLSDAEVSLVKTLLKLMATESTFPWIFSSEGPFDAVLADASVARPSTDTVCVIELVHRGQSASMGAFERPINAPALEGWLHTAERQLKPTSFMGLEYEPLVTSKQAPLDIPVETSAEPFEDNGNTYKLIRWPPTTVLRNDRNRIRLATLITRQTMSLTQLAHISGLSINECESFILVLNALSLVTVSTASPRPLVPTPVMQSNNSPPSDERGKSFGFISAIRRKLGL